MKKEKSTRNRISKKRLRMYIVEFVCLVCFLVYIIFFVVIPKHKYKAAKELMASGKYLEAIDAFNEINKYRYAKEINECTDKYIESLKEAQRYDSAIEYLLNVAGADEDSIEVYKCKYSKAVYLMNQKEYDKAIATLEEIEGYSDSETKLKKSRYRRAEKLYKDGNLEDAKAAFDELGTYEDSKTRSKSIGKEIKYNAAREKLDQEDYVSAAKLLSEIKDYGNAKELLNKAKEKGCEELYNQQKYEECANFCKKYYVYNDMFYSSCYEYGMDLYNRGNVDAAISYLKECQDVEGYSDVNKIIQNAEIEKTYKKGTMSAQKGLLDEAIETLSPISGYRDSATWISKCRQAKTYTGKFESYSYVKYEDGQVYDIGAGQGYGDSKFLWISASIDTDFNITYSAMGKKAEPGTMMVYYHKYGDSDDSYVDIVNKKVVNQFLHNDGSVSATYVTLYK